MNEWIASYWLEDFQSRWKVRQGSDKRLNLFRHDNTFIFNKLEELGFFRFHVTNRKKEIVGVAQVVAFLSYGWKALRNGFVAREGELEVHHIDGDVTNNRPRNLIYLSKQDHLLVSFYSNTPRFGEVISADHTPFNRQGRPIKEGHKRFLAQIIVETVAAVAKARTGKVVRVHFLRVWLQLPKKLYHQILNEVLKPVWMTDTVVQAVLTDDPRDCFV